MKQKLLSLVDMMFSLALPVTEQPIHSAWTSPAPADRSSAYFFEETPKNAAALSPSVETLEVIGWDEWSKSHLSTVGFWTGYSERSTVGIHHTSDLYRAVPEAYSFAPDLGINGLSTGLRGAFAHSFWQPTSTSDQGLQSSPLTSVLDELEALEDGWNGLGTVAPSERVKGDVAYLVTECAFIQQEPEIEVADDGSVALLWDGDGNSFALTFYGDGKVIGTLSPRQNYAAWSAQVEDLQTILNRVADGRITALTA